MQSKKLSMVEVVFGTMFGFVLSLLFWQYVVAPLENIPASWESNMRITFYFTILSIFRGYIVRRLFENLQRITNFIKNTKNRFITKAPA